MVVILFQMFVSSDEKAEVYCGRARNVRNVSQISQTGKRQNEVHICCQLEPSSTEKSLMY